MPLKAAPVWALLGPQAARPESWGVRVDASNLATTGVTKLYIYGEIGYWGVEASDVVEALASVSGPVEVHINSMGGSVFEGLAIYQALVEHAGGVDVVIDGLAASAASFIAMAGRTIEIGAAAHVMIHNASSGCYGTAQDMEATAVMLRNCSTAIAGLYAKRSGKPTDFFTEAMDAETWYIGQEAVDAGLADKVRGDEDEDDETMPMPHENARREPVIDLARIPDPPVAHSPDKIEDEEQRERPVETDGNAPNGCGEPDCDTEPEDSSPSEEDGTPSNIWGHLFDVAIENAGGMPAVLAWFEDSDDAELFDHLTEGAAQ